MNLFKTRHRGLAAFLRYAAGDVAHLSTVQNDNGKRGFGFVFADPEGKCSEMAEVFFAPASCAVADARALLESSRAVNGTISHAIENGGRWDNTEETL